MAVQQLADPKAPAEATRSITVQTVEFTLEISPAPPYLAGQTITLKATVTVDGVPWADARVVFGVQVPGLEGAIPIGDVATDVNGVATLTWTIPWELNGVTVPCKTATWGALLVETMQTSNTVSGAVAYPTRLTISAPGTVPTGGTFEIYGFLSYESSPDVWSPIAGATVILYYNTTLIGSVTTDTDGRYSIHASIPAAGTYTLKAVYAGEGLAFVGAVTVLGVTVGVPPELVTLTQYATYALAATPLLVVGGALVYNELTKRR